MLKQVLIFLKCGQCIELNCVQDEEAAQFYRHFKSGVDFQYELKDDVGFAAGNFSEISAIVINDMVETKRAGF